jgi:hypothetical protein
VDLLPSPPPSAHLIPGLEHPLCSPSPRPLLNPVSVVPPEIQPYRWGGVSRPVQALLNPTQGSRIDQAA